MSIVEMLNNKHPDLNPIINIYNDRAKNPLFSNQIPDYLTLECGSTLFYIYDHISDQIRLTTQGNIFSNYSTVANKDI